MAKAARNFKKDDYSKNKELYEENLNFNGQQIVYRLAMFVLMKEKNFQNKNEFLSKTSLSEKIQDFVKGKQKEISNKEKPGIYEQMKLKNPMDFDAKKLRGKELLEISFQSTIIPCEMELLSKYREQFFDVNHMLFIPASTENFIRNKSESPLKKRVAFDLMESFNDSFERSSYMKEKSSVKPMISREIPGDNGDILNKKGVEKLLENLNSKAFEDIITDIFTCNHFYHFLSFLSNFFPFFN